MAPIIIRDTPVGSKHSASATHTLEVMAKSPRRPRGTNARNVQVAYFIAPEAKDVLVQVSQKLGVSAAEGLETILKHLELDEDGLPAWADRDKAPEAQPMTKAG